MTEKNKVKQTVIAAGLIQFVGPDNSGKSTLALTAHKNPSKICFLDGDTRKSAVFAKQMNIGKYVDLTTMGKGLDELAYHMMVLKQIDEIESGEYEVIVFDNLNEFFKSGHSYVKANRSLFRKNWNPMGAIAGAEEWKELRETHYPRVFSELKAKAPLVIICTPEKAQSDAGVKTGLMIPSSDPSLKLSAEVIIRLARNTRDHTKPAPVGLVVKNTSVYADSKLKRVFPERIVPCEWGTIEKYLNDPVDVREQTAEETPDEFEMHLISGTLNSEQRALYDHRRRMQLLLAEEDLSASVIDAASDARERNVPALMLHKDVQSQLSEQYPDLTVPRVKEILEATKDSVEDVKKQEPKK
jgi:hypothetical protein